MGNQIYELSAYSFYALTTHLSDEPKNKAYRDAKKSISKLGVSKFYFLSSYIIDEIDKIPIKQSIEDELGIQAECFDAKIIAGLLLNGNLLNTFLSDTNYPLPQSVTIPVDYKEMALHSYTLLSDDANKFKSSVFDDTITFILSEKGQLAENKLILEVNTFLEEDKSDIIKRRIDSLLSKSIIQKQDGLIALKTESENDWKNRKQLYQIELSNLSSAQVDLLRNDFETDWTEEDSRKVAIWIANAFISEQLQNLKEAKASIVSNPLFNIEDNGVNKLRNFLLKSKKVKKEQVDEIIEKLLENASGHPLIIKLSRASIYLALNGSNPISSSKALGANRWSDFNILVEPTIAIPYICSQLYKGKVNRFFDNAIKSVLRAQKVDAKLCIPFFYINECAGHLLRARNYKDIVVDENELVYSANAFVSNYYALKLSGAQVPNSFVEYLYSFSSALQTERANKKDWIRAIMTDIQSVLNQGGIEFVDIPFYKENDCVEFEKEYMYYLQKMNIEKKSHLIKHDIWALQFTDDKIAKEHEHWIILTHDKSMISISQENSYKGWITTPQKFIDFTEMTKPLSETKFISLVHSVSTFSEKTLSIGARIIDKIVQFASKDMQNWEFKNEIETIKKEAIKSIDLYSSDFDIIQVDKKVDELLKKHGYTQEKEDEIDIDVQIHS